MAKKKKKASVKLTRNCAANRPSYYQIQRNDKRLSNSRRRVRSNQKIVVDVQFIHITDGAKGKITRTKRKKQIEALNKSFEGHDIEFGYQESEVRTVDNAAWYKMDHGSAEERDAKMALHGSPERHLNFYTAGLTGGLLGWATFPWELEGHRDMDGVVVLDESLPGGRAAPFNRGITAVHELGHWLGLYHTFQSGCNGAGDHIGDTIAHSSPNFGTPDDTLSNGACVQGEIAPVHNYMNYCDDEWLTEFTDAQIKRIKIHVAEYRSKFIDNT